MARKLCIDCGNRTQRTGPGETAPHGVELCNPCYDYAGWENTHSDSGHDDPEGSHIVDLADEMSMCPVCNSDLDRRSNTPRTGHTNTVAKSRNSHAGHGHALTPAARAICRKSIIAGNGPWNGAH